VPVEYYGHKYPIQDCRSGSCIPGYLMWNGYIPAHQINSYDAKTGKPNGIMGVPADYQPAAQPLWPYPADYRDRNKTNDPNYGYYGTNTVMVPLANGTAQEIAYGALHPWKIHFNRLLSFSEQMASRGVPATSCLTSVQVTEDETEPAARLGLAPGSPLVRLERIRYGGGEPFAFETTYLSHIEFPGLAKAMQGRGSLFEILERDHQLTLAYADEEVDATSADARVAEYLDIPRGSPVLRIRQVLCSSSGRKVLYDVGVYRSERHSLLIRRFR
jgi:hypothetical protein